MADNKMLIDASHPEETRVVVLRDGRVEEFDYESAARKLLRGSIFLSKITRVEPSLQAAFVDYGGNRHGFLAFNEIHPDYYQIPHADRQALLEAEFGLRARDDDDDDDEIAVESADADADVEDVSSEAADGHVFEADSDEPDFEADALDVTHLLPEEPADIDTAATEEAEGQPETEIEVAAIEVEQTAADEVAEIDTAEGEPAETVEIASATTDTSESAPVVEEDDQSAADQDESSNSDDTPKGPPKTIAAATPPDDRITSEPVDAVDTQEDLTEELEASSEEVAPDGGESTAEKLDFIADEETESSTDAAEQTASAEQTDTSVCAEATEEAEPSDEPADQEIEARSHADDADGDDDGADEDVEVDEVGESDALEEVPSRARRRVRNYKIQEVIKRRQIVLVQVVKEERGNKGAALTTYLSLAGRYTVLMPNTARGGGISRKITNIQDRKRLKAIAQELDVPEGMGLIIRTAGAARTKQEIKRDFEYLLRLWESVRDLTLRSTAPSLVYEEGDLIKRSIRDLYSRDVEQVLVSGDEAHKEAKSFMRMLMPSHAKNVVKYDEAQPLFTRYRIEQQLNAMFSPFVQLKSGGYLVINQTEALVAVDVNSGKSTRKFSIEDTALNTNLEAAEELTRQLKLRDLAGLIVIDFIDMEEKRNNRAVERRLKECLRDDRARIQVGRISHFGLLEMSRQRLRTGVLEGSTMPCQHCQGTGIIRSTESVALAVLRGLEDQLMVSQPRSLTAQCSRDAAMYLLNQKRDFVQEIETRYGVSIHIEASDEHQGADFAIQRRGGSANGGGSNNNLPRRIERNAVNVEAGFNDETEEGSRTAESDAGDGDERRPRRRRRRRGRRGDAEAANEQVDATTDAVEDGESASTTTEAEDGDGEQGERQSRRRRRGRRGGRNSRGQRRTNSDSVAEPGAPQPDIGDGERSDWHQQQTAQSDVTDSEQPQVEVASGDDGAADVVAQASTAIEPSPADVDNEPAGSVDDKASEATAKQWDTADTKSSDEAAEHQPSAQEDAQSSNEDAQVVVASEVAEDASAAPETPVASHRGEPESSKPVLERIVMTPESESANETSDTAQDVKERPARKGWWQRRFGS